MKYNLKNLKVRQLTHFAKYLRIPCSGLKIELCKRIEQHLAARKIQLFYLKQKKVHCPICLENINPPFVTCKNIRYHNECLILYVNTTGTKIDPILKEPLEWNTLLTLKAQTIFFRTSFFRINLDKIEKDELQSEEENSLLQAIYGTINEFEIQRSMRCIHELQIFFQFFFSTNPNYTIFILKNIIELKGEDKALQNFLKNILARFQIHLEQNETALAKIRTEYKNTYNELHGHTPSSSQQSQQQQNRVLEISNIFEHFFVRANTNNTTNNNNRRASIFPTLGGPMTEARRRRAAQQRNSTGPTVSTTAEMYSIIF